jgi:DNA invertase Pin-like site-specific DNA recombinase
MRNFVIYTRVSTEDQSRSGLGLEAQERDIDLYLTTFAEQPFEIAGRFCDVVSGKDDNRPELAAAIKLAKDTGAELLISKLDRLSRKVSFIAQLMDDNALKIRVAQMPNADKFQLHIYAALAEQERDFISARTKAALQVAKERGVKLGGLRDTTNRRNAAVKAKAAREAATHMEVIDPLRRSDMSLQQIAEHLNRTSTIRPSRGGKWSAMQVSRAIARAT